MAITHVFKGKSDIYGTFAYIENNELVVGENATLDPVLHYHGDLIKFFDSKEYIELYNRNRPLAQDIWHYYFGKLAHRIMDLDQKESMNRNKLCEIKVDRADSLKELVYHLTANGYEVQTAVIWKEFPASGIDCWQIAIFDKEKK